jgi:hypothetical protein
MNYSGMTGLIFLGSDRMCKAVREELGDLPECDLNLSTCEAYIPTGHGSQTYCQRLSIMTVAPTLAKTQARRSRWGVKVWA